MLPKIKDMFIGELRDVAGLLPEFNEPTQWYADGWMAGMYELEPVENPYQRGQFEYWEWQDGYEAALRD